MSLQDIIEFEKMMGMKVDEFATLLNGPMIDKAKLKSMNQDMGSMIDVFTRLANLKKELS